ERARKARLQQHVPNRRPRSFFGSPDPESTFDFLGGPFGGPDLRARAAQEHRRRHSHLEDEENTRFTTFLDDLFKRRDEEDEEDVPVPKKAGFESPLRTQQQPQATPAESKARSLSPQPVPANPSSPSAEPTDAPAPSSPKDHTTSFSLLDTIQSQFDALKSGFTFPANVEFQSTDGPKLTYAAANAPVHQYENELIKLLTMLDAVESDGAESIRGARKALVIAVEKELDRLEEQKRDTWRKTLPAEAAAVALESDDRERLSVGHTLTTMELLEAQDSNAKEVSQRAVDANSVPLLATDDMELDASSETPAEEDVSSSVAEASFPVVPTVEQSSSEEATVTEDEITTSVSSNPFAMTPEAMTENVDPSEDAEVLVDEGSDSESEVEVGIQIEESTPQIPEAVLEGEDDVEPPQADIDPRAKQVELSDAEDFEML
ncbi:hypothetical protein FRB90_008246, partial [Tulasnella sp. 427]